MSGEEEIVSQWTRREQEIQRETQQERIRQEIREELYPKRKCLHRIFVLVSFIAGMSALNMGLGQFVGIIFEQVDPIQYVLRVYVILLCSLVVLNELEWTKFTKESKILNNWISRGAFYSFVGVLGLAENDVTSTDSDKSMVGRHAALMYIKVVAWSMVGCGILYFFMGVLCLQFVCNRLRADYQERRRIAKEKRRSGGGAHMNSQLTAGDQPSGMA